MAKLLKKPGGEKKEANKPAKTEFKSYLSFRLQKRIKPQDDNPKLPSSFRLFGEALLVLKHNLKLFAGMAAVYALLYFVLVQGLTALHGLDDNKEVLNQTMTGSFAGVLSGAALFTQLLGTSATLSSTANTYQFIVTIIASLALIWALRQVYGNQLPRIRDGFYRGMYPLVPFLLVLLVIALELLPLALGAGLLTTVIANGIAATGVEIALWSTGFLVVAVLSLYLITSSVFALYIVCLPDMEPLQALRSSRELVRSRRWQVMRKLLFMPFALLVIAAVIFIPAIMFVTPIIGWMYFLFLMVALAVAHSYLYRLYRSLI